MVLSWVCMLACQQKEMRWKLISECCWNNPAGDISEIDKKMQCSWALLFVSFVMGECAQGEESTLYLDLSDIISWLWLKNHLQILPFGFWEHNFICVNLEDLYINKCLLSPYLLSNHECCKLGVGGDTFVSLRTVSTYRQRCCEREQNGNIGDCQVK